MNKHRRSLQTNNNFQWIRILLCIVSLIVPCCAKITYDEAKFNAFSDDDRHFESKIHESLQTTKNLLAQPEFRTAVLVGIAAGIVYPPAAPVTGIIFVLQGLLAKESDWRETFSAAIARETRHEIAAFTLDWMESTLKTMGKKYHLMIDNSTDIVDRKILASNFHSKIDTMLNLFDRSRSIFKKYPLIATPLLTQLAQLIVFFDPLAKSVLKSQAINGELPCMMHNILLEYRPRAVNDRMEKLRSDFMLVPEFLSFAMESAYYSYGYSITLPPSFKCERCSNASKYCLNDAFGDSYEVQPGFHSACVTDYGLFVRQRIEEFYAQDLIDTLNSSCSKPPQATGFGWFSIKLKHLRTVTIARGANTCDSVSACDPIVKLFIDGDLKLETPPTLNNASYDVGILYTSTKITKKSMVRVEVWDQNDIFSDELILSREASVDSFLKNGHIKKPITKLSQLAHIKPIGRLDVPIYDDNHLNTISFWQDEYKYDNYENV